MKIADQSLPELVEHLESSTGLRLEIGPFSVRIQNQTRVLARFLHSIYADFPVSSADTVADFRIRLCRPKTLRRFLQPQIVFENDGQKLFEPFPLSHAPPLFEWGLNWCIGTSAHQYLILNAAVLERDGRAIIMPALPGSGKSTLCAALMLHGWRLLSDEFGLVRADGLLDPIPRPIPLKNQSIGVIREFCPEATLGPEFPKTRKGTVVHLQPSRISVERMHESATPVWIVFPRYVEDSPAELTPLIPSYALLKLATNSFNYEILGTEGFRRVGRLIRQCQRYCFQYGCLEDAMDVFDSLPIE